MALHRVTGYDDLRKDPKSGAILLSDHAAADRYMARKRHAEREKLMADEINSIKDKLEDFENVKSELSDIKALLQQIANNSGKQ